MRIIICLLTLGFLATSCSQKFSLQKRKYNKGFYLASTNSVHKNSAEVKKSSRSPENNIVEQVEEVIVSEPVASANNSPELTDLKKTRDLSPLIIRENKVDFSEKKETAGLITKKYFEKRKSHKSKTVLKGPLFDFLYNVQVGYMVLSFIIACIFIGFYLLMYFPLPIAIGIMVGFILIMILLAGVGRAVTS